MAKRKRIRRKVQQPKTQGAGFNKVNQSLLIYGPPGVGKTELAASFPDCEFVIDPQEDGINDLVEYDRVPSPNAVHVVNRWKALIETCNRLTNSDSKVVVFDSLTGFEKLCFQHHCAEYFDNDWTAKGFYSYQQGPKNAAKTDWPAFLDCCETLRQSGKHVILVAHSQIKMYSNPEGPDYDRFTPSLDKATWDVTARWAKIILFYNFMVATEKKGVKTKAVSSDKGRKLYTEWMPTYDAKNRHGLDPVIDAGGSGKDAYDNFINAFN